MRFRVLLAAALTVVADAVFVGRADADNEQTPTIKQVMARLNKGATSSLAKLKGELKSDKPNWEAVQKESKDFIVLGGALGKSEPPKGEAASWKKLTDQYFQDAKALDDAANAKDLAAAREAHARLGASCKGCHSLHKGK